MKDSIVKSLIFLFIFQIGTLASGNDEQTERSNLVEGVEKIGGDFIVSKVERMSNGNFQIEFQPTSTVNQDQGVVMISDHVHSAISIGAQVRISAEIIGKKGTKFLASQVLIFISGDQGPVPVWLLSASARKKENLNAAPLLKQHSPQNDFLVF